jgi:hypothetical protein
LGDREPAVQLAFGAGFQAETPKAAPKRNEMADHQKKLEK